MRRILLLFLLLGLSTSLQAAPGKVRLSYTVLKGSVIVATVNETYSRTDNHYAIESVSRAAGLFALFKPEVIRVTSEGTIGPSGLRPDTFSSTRKLDADRNTRADFDWPGQRLMLSDRNGKRTVPLPAGTQDRLSAMYQFMFLKLEDMHELEFDMTNGSKLDLYRYVLARDQNVTVPLGKFRATYAATPEEKGATRSEVWLATDRANVPLKLVITDPEGGTITQVLTGLDIAP